MASIPRGSLGVTSDGSAGLQDTGPHPLGGMRDLSLDLPGDASAVVGGARVSGAVAPVGRGAVASTLQSHGGVGGAGPGVAALAPAGVGKDPVARDSGLGWERVGSWGNTLVRRDQLKARPAAKRGLVTEVQASDAERLQGIWRGALPGHAASKRRRIESKKDVRERENVDAIGGMRNPSRSVRLLPRLRLAGAKIRKVLESFLGDFPEAIDAVADKSGKLWEAFNKEHGTDLRQRLALAMGGGRDGIGYQVPLAGRPGAGVCRDGGRPGQGTAWMAGGWGAHRSGGGHSGLWHLPGGISEGRGL